jgi:hypothetical protein
MKFDLSRIKLSKNDINRDLILPGKPSRQLVEFLGILTGDGYINYYRYQNKYLLEIAGDSKLDKEYLMNYVNEMVMSLFNLNPIFYIRNDQRTMYLRLISKGLINYLIKIGFKKGKKEQINMPAWIASNPEYVVAFLKGVADTDFSVHFRNAYPIISFKSKSKPLIKNVFHFLKRKGFILQNFYKEIKVDRRGYRNSIVYTIKLNGTKNLQLWQNLIGFRNQRHLKKLVRNGAAGI